MTIVRVRKAVYAFKAWTRTDAHVSFFAWHGLVARAKKTTSSMTHPNEQPAADLPLARPVASPAAGEEPVVWEPVNQPLVMAREVPFLSPLLMSKREAWIDLVLLLSIMIGAFGAVIVLLDSGGWQPPIETQIAVQAFGFGALALAATHWRLRAHGHNPAVIGLGRDRALPALGWGMLALLGCYVMNVVLVTGYVAIRGGAGMDHLMTEKTEVMSLVAQTPTLVVFPLTLFVGLYEEIVFRGLFLSRLKVILGGNAWPVVVSSLVFGFFHLGQGPIGAMQATVIGALFGVVAVYRRTIWSCIVAHAALDAVAFFLAPLLQYYLSNFNQNMPQ